MEAQISFWTVVALLLIAFLWLIVLTILIMRVVKQRREVAKSVKEGNLAEVISKSVKDIENLGVQINNLGERQSKTVEDLKGVIQRVGVIRYDAFGDIGGQLSYSVALLNQHGDGVVITSLSGRQESRSYAKPVEKGTSKYDLSKEEKEAIAKALS